MTSPQTFRYLSRADVAALDIDPAAARQAVIDSFAALPTGQTASLPKQALTIGPGHAFQAMVAGSAADNIVTVKWLGITALDHGDAVPRIQALICINDRATGSLLAVMDGDLVTLVRTAAMSAAAATFLAPPAPLALGFIGCGAQAVAHLAAFRSLYPGLQRVHAYSRSRTSADTLADIAKQAGLAAEATASAEAVVRHSNIIVTTVPAAPGLLPFLDPAWLQPDAFVAAVDVGRSWIADDLTAFDTLATDSLTQAEAAAQDGNIAGRVFDCDLDGLAAAGVSRPGGRVLFSFKGFAIADLAVANVVFQQAQSCGIGTTLLR